MTLDEKITILRKSKGISQELLAENSRLSLRTIQRIESGESIPRPYTLKTLANALQVPIEELTSVAYGVRTTIPDEKDQANLPLMNFSALMVLICPGLNILLPYLIWKRHRGAGLIDSTGRRIINFQISWTVISMLALITLHVGTKALTGQFVVGHSAPPAVFGYLILILINCVFIFGSALRLSRRLPIYSFVPELI
jgi:transcriptional regulator with XRE-family HTH domain